MWTSFFNWLTAQMNTFIAAQVGNVSTTIEPAVATMATMYVMMWGYLHLTGKIEEPVLEGGRRIVVLGVILVMTLKLSQNIAPILDIFINSPQTLAQDIVGGGAPTVMGAVDTIWSQGSEVGDALLHRGTLFSGNGWSLICCGIICYLCVGLVTIYVAFLMSLSLVSLGILLAVGPIFIAMLFFDATKRFFEAWIAQLANYALVIILVATIASLLLRAVTAPLAHAYGQGSAVEAVDALRVAVFCGFILLVMRQILPMASALASGVALSSGGIVSGMIRRAAGTGGRFGRGVFDSASGAYQPGNASRLDPLSRKAGQRLAYHAGQGVQAAWRKIRPNEIKPR